MKTLALHTNLFNLPLYKSWSNICVFNSSIRKSSVEGSNLFT